jgi:hypothetical protein
MASYLDALYARVGDNPDLCVLAPCKRKKKNEFTIPVVASSIAVLIVLFILSALAIYRRKIKGGTSFFIFYFCNFHYNL